MQIGEQIKAARKKRRLTQQALGKITGLYRSKISRIENNEQLNLNDINTIADILQNPELNLEIYGRVLPSYNLENIDLSPLAVQLKCLEDIKEAERCLEIKLINKIKPEDFYPNELEELFELMVKLQNLSNSINLFQLSMIENFKLSGEEVNEEFSHKLLRKGYLRQTTLRRE
ncbi:MAG: helix-turn-helix domain-containing protein [Bacillota bacterium]